MSLTDLIKDGRRVLASNKLLREEDDLRILAVNEKKNFRLPILYANNEFFLTRDAAWTGFAVPNKPWGFLDESSRKQYFYSSGAIFDRIFPADKENAGHLLVTNRVYSADEWEEALLAKYEDTASEDFARYVKASRANIERREFFERECYLFARTGARGAGSGMKGWVRSMIESVALGGGMDDSQPDEEEIKFWSQQSNSVVDTLSSSWLTAQPVHRRRVEWIVRHLDTPGLPTPDTAPADEQEWGAGEWRTVLSSYTREIDLGVVGRNRYRCVEFDAPVGAGKAYAAYLPLNHIPSQLYGGTNWIHHASSLTFPVDVSLRFEIIDPDRAEKELERPIYAAEAQEEEDAEAGYRPDETTQIQQQGLRQVKTSVRMGRQPLAFWQAVFCVYDTDKDELLSKVTKLIKHYNDIQFKLECPRNDQRELFYQSFPGSEVLVQDWMHRTDTQYLAASMPWLTSTVGDRDGSHGLWQGHTIVRDANGVPKKGVPVFFDLQNVVDDEGKAPTEVVCGFPGSGKTVSRGLKVAHEDALRGITQFVWDPKGDFLPLKRYAERMRLNPDKVKLVDLYDPANSVSLDAFALAEVDEKNNIDERVTSALDVLSALCRDYVESQEGIGYQSVLRSAVLSVMEQSRLPGAKPPSMKAVLETIKRWRNKDFEGLADLEDEDRVNYQRYARILDDHLSQGVKSSVLGQLLFRDPYEYGTMKVSEGDLVIFIAIKMNPTDPGQKPTMSSAISDVISGLMTDYIRSLLFTLPDEVPKAAVFDEWHVIKRTTRAQALLDWLRRMGRSKRCSVRQMSQSATDFEKGSLSAVWCGYAQNEEEAVASCELLGIEASESNVRLLQGLSAGQFLFRDALGRVAHVAVDIWDDWLLSKFNTQAKAKAAMLAEMREQEEKARRLAAARAQQALPGDGSAAAPDLEPASRKLPDQDQQRADEPASVETVVSREEPATQTR